MGERHTQSRRDRTARTRACIVAASARAFACSPYREVTLDALADEAELSVPTLLSYFPTKAKLALAPEWTTFEEVRQVLGAQDRSRTTLDIWRELVVRAVPSGGLSGAELLQRTRYLSDNDALARETRLLVSAYQELLSDALARDVGTDSTDLRTGLLAVALVRGNSIMLDRWAARRGRRNVRSDALAVIDFAVDRLSMDVGSSLRPADDVGGVPRSEHRRGCRTRPIPSS